MINKVKLAWIQIIIAIILVTAVTLGLIKAKVIISMLLLFLIFLELIRTITTYINEGTTVSIRYLIDGSFIFMLRELLYIFTDVGYTFENKVYYTILIISIMLALLGMRVVAIKLAPKRDKIKNV